MNDLSRLIAIFCCCCITTQLLGLDANVSHLVFMQDQKPYVELNLHISSRSLTPVVRSDSSMQTSVHVLILFKQDGEIKQYDKFLLQSPLGAEPTDFLDLKRYALPLGDYQLEIELQDAHDPTNTAVYKATLAVHLGDLQIQQSDILLLADVRGGRDAQHPLYRNGMIMEPLPYAFYNRQAKRLIFYNELYSSSSEVPIRYVYRIERLLNGQSQPVLTEEKSRKSAAKLTMLVPVDIADLPSGNYRLIVEVYVGEVKQNQRMVDWQRSNPEQDQIVAENMLDDPDIELFTTNLSLEELQYGLRAITVHVPQDEQAALNTLIKEGNKDAQSRYLYVFWARQDAFQPQQAYEQYMQVVTVVDKEFKSGFRHGFETDRGYVYLKFGQPSDIVREENDPSAPPYEIWSYNALPETGQNNVRFIFYNPSLAGGDFQLLHSDVIGEIQNPNWQLELYRNAPDEDLPDNSMNGGDVKDNMGRRARRLLRDY